jgi:hypothetical protein
MHTTTAKIINNWSRLSMIFVDKSVRIFRGRILPAP